MGTIVRVPLSGRSVRGYVVELADRDPSALKDIGGISSDLPVFTESSLESLMWAAEHYVAPLAVLLDRAAPPNLPRVEDRAEFPLLTPSNVESPLSKVALGAIEGKESPPVAVITSPGPPDWIADVGPVLQAGGCVMVIVATVAEAELLTGRAHAFFGPRVVTAAGGTDRELTSAWALARQPGSLLVGTPRVATWSIPSLGLCVVIEEGRRAMKDRQTPTIHVRDVLLHRSAQEGFAVAFLGPTPSVELLAAGATLTHAARRAWSRIEVVDRSEDPPGAGYLSDRTVGAVRGAVANGWRTLVFTHRRIGDESLRCTNCRAVRLCARCGSRLGREDVCRRCSATTRSCRNCGGGEFESMGTIPERLRANLRHSLGSGVAEIAPDSGPVIIGTERDLAGSEVFDLVVVADADGLAYGHDYRSSEEALRVLGRLGNLVRQGTGRRMIIQTSVSDSSLMQTMRAGDPVPYLESVLAERIKMRLPPVTEMLALELRGEIDLDALRGDMVLEGVTVMGPAVTSEGARWLIQGDLARVRPTLRRLVGQWRDRGMTVRVDADPIDL